MNSKISSQEMLTIEGADYAANVTTDGIPGVVRQTDGLAGLFVNARVDQIFNSPKAQKKRAAEKEARQEALRKEEEQKRAAVERAKAVKAAEAAEKEAEKKP